MKVIITSFLFFCITIVSYSQTTYLEVQNNTGACTTRIVPMVKIPNSGCSLTAYPGVNAPPGTTVVFPTLPPGYELASVVVYPMGWGGTGLVLYNPDFPSIISPECENGTGSSSTITGSCESSAQLVPIGPFHARVIIN